MNETPINTIEINVGRCPLVFGQAPCAASGAVGTECYNTRETCQSVASYTEDDSGSEAFSRGAIAVGVDAVQYPANTSRPVSIGAYRFPFLAGQALPAITDNSAITLAELYAEVADIAALHGGYDDVIGQSVHGRDLRCLRLFDVGDRPIVVIVCGTHGDEVASVRGWLAAIRWVLNDNGELARAFRESCALYFVPSHNPDGHVNSTRRNANNVNLNRNWPYFWDVATDTDKGIAPLSEPECAAISSYLDSYGRAARLLCCVDVHGWSSRNTWGFLTEQIYHTRACREMQRRALNYANSIIRPRAYSAVNGPVELTEYRSKRRPYVYTWAVNKGRDDAWGGIIEFPEAESNSLNATVAQDIFVGLVQAVVDQVSGYESATVVESGVKPEPLNNNSDLSSWHSTYPRPSWTSYSRLRLSQVYDELLQRNVCESYRPDEVLLTETRHSAGYVSLLDQHGHVDGYVIGGRSSSYIAEVDAISVNDGSISVHPDLPISVYNSASATDGATIYAVGGYSGVYEESVYAYTPGGAWSSIVNKLIINGGIQRAAAVCWGGLVIYAGGRNAVGYLDEIVAVNPVTKHQYVIGLMTSASGYRAAALNGDDLYLFGEWTGSTHLASVNKLTLVDNLIGSAADGVVEEVGGVTTGDFLSSSYTFSAADVGRRLTIQFRATDSGYPVSVGEYTISAFVDAGRVTLDSLPAYSAGDNVNLEFTVTSAPPTCLLTTSIPESRSRMALAQNGSIVYLFGGNSFFGPQSQLWEYDMATDTVAAVNYTLYSWEDDYGVIQSVEEPVLAGAAMFYDSIDDTLMIVGGEDELGAARSEIYQITLENNVCSNIASDATTYGFLRSSSKYTVAAGEKYTLAVTARNMSPRNDNVNPYVRLVARFGPLSGATRYQRTWYMVPTRDGYYTIMMPIEIRPTDGTELRVYLRHYTADTTVRLANLQLLSDREALTLPVVEGNTAADVRAYSFPGGLALSRRFELSGSFSPLIAANSTSSALPLLLFKNEGGGEVLRLAYIDSHDPSSNSADNGIYRCTYAPSGYSGDQAGMEVNYNRSSGKEWRGDVIHWSLTAGEGGLTLQLYHCGLMRRFDIDNSVTANISQVEQLNGVHAQILLNGHSLYGFCDVHGALPVGLQLIPSVKSVRHTPAELHHDGGLGSRASLDVILNDHPHHDRGIDPYVETRPYDTSQGTFWGKFMARNPYYVGSSVVHGAGGIKNGMIEVDERDYFISDIVGPSKGTCKITAKDWLKSIDDDLATCPKRSRGILAGLIGFGLDSFEVSGGEQYFDAGIVLIDSEFIRYTRVGSLFTAVERGVGGTEIAEHDIDADVQQAAEFSGNVVEVIRDILVDYGGVGQSRIPYQAWLSERDQWLLANEVYAIIGKPEGINKLLNELCKSNMIHLAVDELQQLIILKAIVPISDGYVPIVDESSYLRGTLSIKPDDKKRVTEVWMSYGPEDYSKKDSLQKNYVAADLDASGPYRHGGEKINHIKTRWFSASSSGLAAQVANRYLAWFKTRPVYAEFECSSDWARVLRIGALFDLSAPELQGTGGLRVERRMQVLSAALDAVKGRLLVKAISIGAAGIAAERYCRIMPEDAADYDQATASEKINGGYISPEAGDFSDDGGPYLIL